MTWSILLILLLNVYTSCMALTIGFLCYAALRPHWRELPLWAQVWLLPLVLFYPVDIFVRFTVGTILFMEPPTLKHIKLTNTETWTVTYLCNSHVNDVDGSSFHNYKRKIARGLCKVLCILQPGHCGNYVAD